MIQYANRHILDSPYTINATPSYDSFKVKSDCQKLKTVQVGDFVSFNVDCSTAGDADIEVGVYDSDDVNCIQDSSLTFTGF